MKFNFKSKKKNQPVNKKKIRYNSVSSAVVALFLVCIIAVNVLAGILTDRFTALSFDLTDDSQYTLSDKNIEYIKKIDKKINIIVTCTEDYYTSEFASYYEEQSYYNADIYFPQTVEILKRYARINKNVTVEFVDATTPDFYVYRDKFSDISYSIGDLIVDYTYEDEKGREKTKFKVLTFDDIYEVTQTDDYSYYEIVSSRLETSLTSALYYVANVQEDKIGLITDYGATDVSEYLENLQVSGYDYVEISDLSVQGIPKDVNILMLAAPRVDFAESDIKLLDEFLLGRADDDSTEYGNTLVYFASSAQTNLFNLDAFLANWGIAFEDGTVCETDRDYYSNKNSEITVYNVDDEYVGNLNSDFDYYTKNSKPMSLLFESQGKFYNYDILKTYPSAVKKPFQAGASWNSGDAEKQEFSSVVLSRYVTEDPNNDNQPRFSNILAVSSIDFISNEFTSVASCGNDELMLSLLNTCADRVEKTYEIESKIINKTYFVPNNKVELVLFVVCAIVIPVIILIACLVVMIIRRKR